MDEVSGIVQDFDEHRNFITGSDDNGNLEYIFEQNARQRRFPNRRHSLGDGITTLTPVKANRRFLRRCSLQTPRRINDSHSPQYCISSADLLLSNSRSPEVPMVGLGSELFIAFLHEEINRSHLKVPESLQNASGGLSSTQRDSGVVDEFLNLGTHLRLMADEFANSDHRRRVREHAEDVPLNSLNAESFTDLLFGMFQQGGITCERVLVLFVFCADLAVRALREHLLTCFHDVMSWSQFYIESWLTPWIQRHGGWAVVLERSVNEAYKAAVIGTCMVGMIALWTYIRTASH